MFFSIVFQARTGKKLQEKNHGKNHGTRNYDAKHFTSESDDFIERPLKMTSFIVKHGLGQPTTTTR